MNVSDLSALQKQFLNSANTIQSPHTVDYFNGGTVAIAHIINIATAMGGASLNKDQLMMLYQFCSDRMMRFSPASEDLDKGIVDGYAFVKSAINTFITS